MSNRRIRRAQILSAVAAICTASRAFGGYTLGSVVTFTGSNGSMPTSSLTLAAGFVYGTTELAPVAQNSVFSIATSSGQFTNLAGLGTRTSDNAPGAVIVSGNTLYGTTGENAYNDGTIYSLPSSGGTPTTLLTFNSSSGANPTIGFVAEGSTVYGTSQLGGASNDGIVFSLSAAGGPLTTLATFNNSNGKYPGSPLIQIGTALYGTTELGGANGSGTVFSVPLGGGPITTIETFNGSNGATPYGPLVLSGSTLYGTTESGGANNSGVVFSLPLAGGPVTTLATFNGSNGSFPTGVTVSGGMLYGTTRYGGYGGAGNNGTVFSVPISGGPPKTLAAFNGSNGANPLAAVTLVGNVIYGTTSNGGSTYDGGTVFSLTPNPVAAVSTTTPTAFGSPVGALNLAGGVGKYAVATATFPATPTGYLTVTGFNPSSDTEVFALNVADSVPANLAVDLADAVSEMDSLTYTGYSLAASTTDPTGEFGGGYDFFISITNSTLGTGSPDFGFDFTQLNGITDTLSVSSAAAVPEPASLSVIALVGLASLRRRK